MLMKFEWEKSRICTSLSLEIIPSRIHLLSRFPLERFRLEGFQARNHSCHGCQWACFVFLHCQIVAGEYCEAVSSATGGWEDVVSTWIACLSEEQLSAKVGSSDSLGSELVSYSNTGDTIQVLASFFRSFLAFISSRTGGKMVQLPRI